MLEKPLARKDGKPERAVLVGLATRDQPRALLAEYLDELEFLARTANAETIRSFTQSLDHPDVRTFVGKGKLQEITTYIEENDIDLLIFDDELSPSQLRNLGEALPETKVLDRANLILDIFAQRARTAHAKTQVELAQYQYLLPRLTRMWTHLQKQKGGIGMKGPGRKKSRRTAGSSATASPPSRRTSPPSTGKWPPSAATAAPSSAWPSWVIPMPASPP